MEFISKEKIVELSNPGVVSRQLLNPENSSSTTVFPLKSFFSAIISAAAFIIYLSSVNFEVRSEE